MPYSNVPILCVAATSQIRPVDKILSGNWLDKTLCEGEVYDTVLADYCEFSFSRIFRLFLLV